MENEKRGTKRGLPGQVRRKKKTRHDRKRRKKEIGRGAASNQEKVRSPGPTWGPDLQAQAFSGETGRWRKRTALTSLGETTNFIRWGGAPGSARTRYN